VTSADSTNAEDRPVLDQVNLVVRDMPATVDFYRRLGLTLPDQGPWNAYHRSAEVPTGLDLDFDSADFAPKWNRGFPGLGERGTVVIGFRVGARETVDRIYADLTEAGHHSQQEPYDAFWGSRYAIVEDPDGNAIGIMSPMDERYRGAPPEM
jgi:catechol 2,3-dioxygenase-like lactoylglutathione lyase family enzyme